MERRTREKQFRGGQAALSINAAGESECARAESEPQSERLTLLKKNSKWIMDLNVKDRTSRR